MERLEKNAIEILHMICERSECIICDSGGKDSSVLKHIALQAKEKYGLQFRVRHNHTTVDAPETVYFVREEKRKFEQMGIPYEIHYPNITLMRENPDTGEKERVQVGTRQVVSGERERLMIIQDRCMKQCRQGASDFGLTVSSRCRLVVPKPQQQKPENKFAKYAN